MIYKILNLQVKVEKLDKLYFFNEINGKLAKYYPNED